MNEVKTQIRNIVNEEMVKISERQKLKSKIKPLQEVIWIDGSSGRGDENDMETLNQMYDNNDYQGMLDYLAQWDYGEDSGGEIYDDVQQYDDVLLETPEYILVTVDPIHYWGDRAYGLYVKISAEEAEQRGLL